MAEKNTNKILDNKNIIDIGAQLVEREKEYHGKLDFIGMTALTMTNRISSSRSIMFTSHLKQFVTLKNPEFPRVFTNFENPLGHRSSSIQRAGDETTDKHGRYANYEIMHRISKFEDKPDHLYLLFVYNKELNKWDVIEKKIAEELTEKFGYEFNNTRLDSFKKGDIIQKGETLWKSTSYDEDDNYCYGVNAKVVYLIDNRTIEDAVVVSDSFCKRMISTKVDKVKISINDNDILCNIYGEGDEYKGFPDIGQKVKDCVVAAKRRVINDQILFDMKSSNLKKGSPFNDKFFYASGKVIDVDIYSNKDIDEIEDNDYNQQFIYYLKNQNRYYTEIFEFIEEEIFAKGCNYSDDIGFWYTRAKNIIDPNYKGKDQENVFSNILLEVTVEQDVGLGGGYKLTGRYGNKGVISTMTDTENNKGIKVKKDTEMPYYYTNSGEKVYVDVIFNTLGVCNRLNPGQTYEVELNFIADNIAQRLRELKSHSEKWAILSKFLKHFNEFKAYDELCKYYNSLSKKEKDEFYYDIEYVHGIYINIPPFWEDKPLFDKVMEIYDEFPWIKPYQCYIEKWGREIPMMEKLVVGEEYILKLKQTSKKNFSARSTGYLSQKGLPDKTSKLKNNQQLYSTTPIRLGRDENTNINCAVPPEIVAKLHLFYRSSPIARRAVSKLYTGNVLNFKKFKIKPGYINLNVKILLVYLKAMGYKIDYGKHNQIVVDINDGDEKLETFFFKGKMYLTTRSQMKDFLLDERLKYEYKKSKLVCGTIEDVTADFEAYKQKRLAELKNKRIK